MSRRPTPPAIRTKISADVAKIIADAKAEAEKAAGVFTVMTLVSKIEADLKKVL